VRSSSLTFWRFIGATISTIVLLVCLPLYFNVIIDDLTSADQRPASALILILGAIGGFALASGLMWLSARVYAKVTLAVCAVVWIVMGFFMLVFAPVYRQINAEGIAEYRASNAMLVFGTLTLGAGIVLGSLCIRWATRPHALVQLNRWRRPMGAAYGVLMGIIGLLLLGILAIAFNVDDGGVDEDFGVVATVVLFTALAMQFFVPGVILAYHGISSSMGERSGEFKAPVGAVVVFAFVVVLLIGQLNMALDKPIAGPMPFIHTLAAMLPGVGYIAFAARGSMLAGRLVRGITWRQVTLAWALAIAVGAMSAGFVNSVGGLGVTVLLLANEGAFEDLPGIGSPFGDEFSFQPVWDVIGNAEFILSDTQQWIANILAIAVIPPFGEEFLKGLSVRFLMRRNTTAAQAFLLGAAAGAGFGFVEALLYGAGVTADNLSDWWLIMLIRGGSTSLHCLNTGLVGVAWWYWSIAARKRPAIAMYLLAVLFHAIWNGFAVTLDSELFWVGTLEDATIERIAYAFVAIIGLVLVASIPLVARRLREPPPPSVTGTPLASMTPLVAI
jgi:hypothetical protein